MKLLIITQKVDRNDDILGFFAGWIAEFAKHCEKVTVICLQKGEHNLPDNVKVLSLGKEERASKFKYILNFYKYIFRERKNYDTVFVHMNQAYVILGWIFWKLAGKKIGFWYAHGSVFFSLKVAEKMVDIIFTSTKSGFRLASQKKRVVGQGIDTEKFKPCLEVQKNDGVFRIISVGRISPVKDYETLINAVEILALKGLKLSVDIVGATGLPEQEKYLSTLEEITKQKNLSGMIKFTGATSNEDIAPRLQSADLFVNMSHTGSLDKAILEAMACGLPVLTCNEALLEVLGEYKDKLMYPKKDFKTLAGKISGVIGETRKERNNLGIELREIVVQNHGLENLIKKILKIMRG